MNIAGTAITVYLTLQDDLEAAQDLTSATMSWRLSRSYSVPAVLIKPDSDITVTDAEGGLAEVDLDALDTADLQGTYYHEIEADYGSEDKKKWQLGIITFAESE